MALLVIAIASVVGLGGCVADQGAATVVETPAIHWVDGVKPSSPLEKSRYVKFLRAQSLGSALALNLGDFTIKQLTDYAQPSLIKRMAAGYLAGDVVQLGPEPFQPLDVVEDADGKGAAVTFCAYLDSELLSPPLKDAKGAAGRRAQQNLLYLKTSPNGLLYYAGGEPASGACDGSQIPIGYFDPAPVARNQPGWARDPLPSLVPGQPDDVPTPSPSPSDE